MCVYGSAVCGLGVVYVGAGVEDIHVWCLTDPELSSEAIHHSHSTACTPSSCASAFVSRPIVWPRRLENVLAMVAVEVLQGQSKAVEVCPGCAVFLCHRDGTGTQLIQCAINGASIWLSCDWAVEAIFSIHPAACCGGT